MNALDIIDERYRLVRPLGTGGMAEVWLAEDLRLGRHVALKVLLESVQAAESGLVAMGIEDEARVVARLQHPNIVAVYDAGTVDGRSYLVMEYVEGQSLRDVLDASGRLPEEDAVRYGQQVAAALAYAHSQGVVHCDVKPENLLVSAGRDIKITDFGVAGKVTRTLTPQQAREVLGTVAYLAPEVMQGEQATPASDIYSLALTVFELVAGRLPFTGATPALVAAQRLATPAPALRSLVPSASPSLDAALARALVIRPEQRFRDAEQFRQALASTARPAGARQTQARTQVVPVPPLPAGQPPRRPPTGRVQRMQPPRSSGPGAALIVAVIGIALLAVGVGALAFALLTENNGGDNGGTPSPTTPPATATSPEPTPTDAPTETPTVTPTSEPSLTPTPTETPTETPTPTEEPTEEPTETPEPSPTAGETPDRRGRSGSPNNPSP